MHFNQYYDNDLNHFLLQERQLSEHRQRQAALRNRDQQRQLYERQRQHQEDVVEAAAEEEYLRRRRCKRQQHPSPFYEDYKDSEDYCLGYGEDCEYETDIVHGCDGNLYYVKKPLHQHRHHRHSIRPPISEDTSETVNQRLRRHPICYPEPVAEEESESESADDNVDTDSSDSDSSVTSDSDEEDVRYVPKPKPKRRVVADPKTKAKGRSSLHSRFSKVGSGLSSSLRRQKKVTRVPKAKANTPALPLHQQQEKRDQQEQQQQYSTSSRKQNRKRYITVTVEDASDSECENEFDSPWRNRRPGAGMWIEPVEPYYE